MSSSTLFRRSKRATALTRRAENPRTLATGFAHRRPPGLAQHLALALALFAAPAASAQIAMGGYVFDDLAAPDLAVPMPGSHPEFAGLSTGCLVAPTLGGLTLGESVQEVFTDDSVSAWTFGNARARLDFLDNEIINAPGPDLVVFEIGGAEAFSLRIFRDSICEWSSALNFTPVATGFTVNPCGTGSNPLNAVEIDLDDYGVLPGARVRRLLIDSLGAPGGAVGADLVAVMALNSVAPASGPADCLRSFQQGIDAGAGTYTGAADTALASDQPGSNLSSAPLDYVDGSPERNLLLRFDGLVGEAPGQVPPGATVTRATLTLKVGPGASASTGTHTLHRLLQPWNAATITWANGFGGDGVQANGSEAELTALATVPAQSANALLVLDVTEAVQAWSDGAPNHGFALLSDSADALGMHLAEAPVDSLRPALSVELGGQLGYAEAVADFSPVIINGQPSACYLVASQALGAPDTPENAPTGCCQSADTTVTLGVGGSITLEFTSISISGNGSPEPDLWIYERGPDVEDTFVELSADGVQFVSVGKVFGSVSSLDIDQFGYGPLSLFRYIRLTDDPAEGQTSGCSVGADIDAVAALAPNPWINLGSALPGSNGSPKLAAAGVLDAGGPVTFALTSGKPNAPAWLVLGPFAIHAPLKGGTLVPHPLVIVPGLPLGPTGALILPLAWPAGIPAGVNILVQCWIMDAAGPKGFAATNAIKSVTH